MQQRMDTPMNQALKEYHRNAYVSIENFVYFFGSQEAEA